MHDHGSTLAARGWMVSAAAVAAVLLQLSSLLGASPSTATGLVVLSIAVVGALVALSASSSRLLVAPTCRVVSGTDADHAPVVRGRATDPTHHPLAPRAPGPA